VTWSRRLTSRSTQQPPALTRADAGRGSDIGLAADIQLRWLWVSSVVRPDCMTLRRVIVDGLIIVAVVGLLALPYLLPDPKCPATSWPPPAGTPRLLIGAPVFGTCTNAGRVFSTISLTVSNTGPEVEYVLSWFECRRRDDLTVLDFGVPSGCMRLRQHQRTNLTLLAPSSVGAVTDLLVCGSLHWYPRPPAAPALRRLVDSHSALTGVAGTLERGWPGGSAPWNWTGNSGDAFTSNIGVAEYFRLVYGMDRNRCEEEDRAAQEVTRAFSESRRQALKAQRPLLQYPPRTARDEVRALFHYYCRSVEGLSVTEMRGR
jgi:hypothetical protein